MHYTIFIKTRDSLSRILSRDLTFLSFPPTTIIIGRCTVHVDRYVAAFQTGGSEAGTSRERDANAINQSSKSTREGSIVEIGNVPIFVGSESWLFEKGRVLPLDGGAMIGVINAIIYGRLRATPRPPRLRADTSRSDR